MLELYEVFDLDSSRLLAELAELRRLLPIVKGADRFRFVGLRETERVWGSGLGSGLASGKMPCDGAQLRSWHYSLQELRCPLICQGLNNSG